MCAEKPLELQDRSVLQGYSVWIEVLLEWDFDGCWVDLV